MTQGILYVATGKKYIQAAIRSAYSVDRFAPDLPTHLFSDIHEVFPEIERQSLPFTSIGRILNPHRRSKLDFLSHSPYDETLYLDSDTRLNADIREMYTLLDRFDIALCHAHRRKAPERTQSWQLELPAAFPQFNSGVMLYRNTPAVQQFLDSWTQAYQLAGFRQDQTTLRELLWRSDLKVATLPPEYNVRFIKYHILWGKTEASTKIFHRRKYHDGSLWFVKRTIRSLVRPLLKWPLIGEIWPYIKGRR